MAQVWTQVYSKWHFGVPAVVPGGEAQVCPGPPPPPPRPAPSGVLRAPLVRFDGIHPLVPGDTLAGFSCGNEAEWKRLPFKEGSPTREQEGLVTRGPRLDPHWAQRRRPSSARAWGGGGEDTHAESRWKLGAVNRVPNSGRWGRGRGKVLLVFTHLVSLSPANSPVEFTARANLS